MNLILEGPRAATERVVSPTTSLWSLKQKIHQLTGLPAASLLLRLAGQDLSADNDEETLVELGLRDGDVVHYSSSNVAALRQFDALDDEAALAQVEKFELTDEDYASRSDTVQAYKKRNQLGRFAPEAVGDGALDPAYRVGVRCEFTQGGRRGTVAFVGTVEFARGVWIGVMLDEPQPDKGDGAINGKRYFDTTNGRAAFVKPQALSIGEYPERDLFGDEDGF